MRTLKFKCAHCGKAAHKAVGAVNRARRSGFPLYCNRTCAGLGRRTGLTKAEKVAAKRLYDLEYRAKNLAMLKAKKAAYFQRSYDPDKARIERKKRAHLHAEYCRQPEYRVWKREYDRHYRATTEFAEYAEAYMLLLDLERELDARASWYERANQKGTVNKTIRRKREYEQSVRHQS